MENQKIPGIIDLIKKAIEVFKGNPWVYIGIGLITFLVIFAIGLVFGILTGATIYSTIAVVAAKKSLLALFAGGFIGLLFLVILFAVMIIAASWTSASMLFAVKERQRKIEIKESLSLGWKFTVSFFWISILNAIVVGIGFILFVIPGIILAIWLCFSTYILIWENVKGIEALKRSKNLVSGYWWPVFWRFLGAGIIMAVLNMILNFIPLVGILVIAFVIAPVFMIYSALVYEEIKKIKGGLSQIA